MTKTNSTPQQKDEKNRQRAYDVNASKAKPPRGTKTDRGYLRSDGEAKPDDNRMLPLDRQTDDVVSPRDERHPNAPETQNADYGAHEEETKAPPKDASS